MFRRSRWISPVETVDPNSVDPNCITHRNRATARTWEKPWRFNLLVMILLEQYLLFRTRVVAVGPETNRHVPSHLDKGICDTNVLY